MNKELKRATASAYGLGEKGRTYTLYKENNLYWIFVQSNMPNITANEQGYVGIYHTKSKRKAKIVFEALVQGGTKNGK